MIYLTQTHLPEDLCCYLELYFLVIVPASIKLIEIQVISEYYK